MCTTKVLFLKIVTRTQNMCLDGRMMSMESIYSIYKMGHIVYLLISKSTRSYIIFSNMGTLLPSVGHGISLSLLLLIHPVEAYAESWV
jgi:hypothetical protein